MSETAQEIIRHECHESGFLPGIPGYQRAGTIVLTQGNQVVEVLSMATGKSLLTPVANSDNMAELAETSEAASPDTPPAPVFLNGG